MDKNGWASSAGGGAPGKPRKASLLARMKKIEALRSMVEQLPDIREHLVRTLREEIENGRYRVDPRKVAERMMEELL